MNTSGKNDRSVGRRNSSKVSGSSSALRSRDRTFSRNGRHIVKSATKRFKEAKRRFKILRSTSRSTSRSDFTSRTLSELSNFSTCNKFGLENIMNKIFKSKIFVCADQCYAFDGVRGISVSYKFIIASEFSPFFSNSNYEVKAPLAVYESAVTSHVVKSEHSRNNSYGNSKIVLQIFEGHVIYKRDIQIPYVSSSNNDLKEILSNKVRIEHMYKKFSNNSYKFDDEILEWPEEISTYVVNSDVKFYGNEVHLKDIMEVWFGMERFQHQVDDYNVATVTYREKEAFHRSAFEMKAGESCAKISRKLVFPTSVIGETFEIAYTKEFYMNYINGKWIRESESKCSNKNNLNLLSDITSFAINGDLTINDKSYDIKEVPRYHSKISNISSSKNSIKNSDNLNTSNIPTSKIPFKDTLVPISHSTPRTTNILQTKKTNETTFPDNKSSITQNNIISNFSKNITPNSTMNNHNENSTQNIYYSILSNGNISNRCYDTPNRQLNKEKNSQVKETIDRILGDVAKHASNIVDIVKNQNETKNDTTMYYSGNEETPNLKLKLDTPKVRSASKIKSPIVFESKPAKDSPLKQLLEKLDTTQSSNISQSSIKLENDSNKTPIKNNLLLLTNDNNCSGNLSLINGKSLSTIKEMSLEQGQTHCNPSKSTISIFSTKTNNFIPDDLSKFSNIQKESNETSLLTLEKTKYINSFSSTTSLTNSSTKDIEEDTTQNESKESLLTYLSTPAIETIPFSNEHKNKRSLEYTNLQPTPDKTLNTKISTLSDCQNLSLSCTQIDSKTCELNNSNDLHPTTPLNMTSERPIIMKSVVRDSPNIKRPKTPTSSSRSIFTPIKIQENRTGENKEIDDIGKKASNHNTMFSYLQTSRILQTPTTIKRTTSAFGLRGNDSHTPLLGSSNNENVFGTPKKNLYRTLSATPTKRCRSSSYNVGSVDNLNDENIFRKKKVHKKRNESLKNDKKYFRKTSPSPLRNSMAKNSPRSSRNTDIKKTSNSFVDKSEKVKMKPLNEKKSMLEKSSNNSNSLSDTVRKIDEGSKELDIGTFELINNLQNLSLQKIENTTPILVKHNAKYNEYISSSNIINNDVKCNHLNGNISVKVETLVLIDEEIKKLTHIYTFNGFNSSKNIKILSLVVDGKNFYKSSNLYNISIHN